MTNPISFTPQEHTLNSSCSPSAIQRENPDFSGIEFTVARFKKWDQSDHVSVVALNRDKQSGICALMLVVDGDRYNQDVQLYVIGRDNRALGTALNEAGIAIDAYSRLHLHDGMDARDDTEHLALLSKERITEASQVRKYFSIEDQGIEALRIFSTGGGIFFIEKLKDTLKRASSSISGDPGIAASMAKFVLNFFSEYDRREPAEPLLREQ